MREHTANGNRGNFPAGSGVKPYKKSGAGIVRGGCATVKARRGVSDTSIGFNLTLEGTLDREPSGADAYLLEGLRTGAEAAYESLISRFQQPVYNLVMRLVGDPADANDVVQEVFLKVFRNVGSFRGQSSLKTWVYRIAVNEAYNHRRWFSRHRKHEVGIEPEEESQGALRDSLPDPGRSPFEIALNDERRVVIEEALAGINPTFRAAVVLRDIEDLSYDEIAEIMQVSLGTVKSRILRGRDALRNSLAIAKLTRQREARGGETWGRQPAGSRLASD